MTFSPGIARFLAIAPSVFALGFVPFTTACFASPRAFETVESTMVARRGMRIAGAGFELENGGARPTPFTSRCWDGAFPVPVGQLAERYEEGRAAGARPVRVTVPGRETPLYGLLLLCESLNYAYGPASRVHTLDVPAEELAALDDGSVVAVYERADWMRPYLVSVGYWVETRWQEEWWYGWVLWVSDEAVF